MSNENNLSSLLSETVKHLTDAQLKVFRAELKRSLPIVVKECDKKAKTTRSDATE